MTATRTRLRIVATPIVVGLVAMLGAACAPPPKAPTGIIFNVPAVGYIGKQLTPTASAPNNLPVEISLGEASSGCTLSGGVLYFTEAGSCIILASQTSTETTEALPTQQRLISVQGCPPLREGLWTGPQGTSASVNVAGTIFWGTVDLSAFGSGVWNFDGTIDCDLVRMVFNGTSLSGRLSPDGMRLSASYSGISVVLNAPPE